MENLEKCFWYNKSREQRETEINRGEGIEGTSFYEDTGCYKCDGDDSKCQYNTKTGEKE
jgi:hypothetical protein